MIHIITGDINSGKTRYLKKLYEKNPIGDGVLSIKHYDESHFLGYDLIHLKSNEQVAFIRLKSQLPENWNEKFEIGKYSFSSEGFDFAEMLLKNIEEGPVYLDEVGPLEILEKKGFYNTLKELIEKKFDMFLTLRGSLIDAALDEFDLKGKTKIVTLK